LNFDEIFTLTNITFYNCQTNHLQSFIDINKFFSNYRLSSTRTRGTAQWCHLTFNKKVFELSTHQLSARRPSCDQHSVKSP